jgi:hypothetical protein
MLARATKATAVVALPPRCRASPRASVQSPEAAAERDHRRSRLEHASRGGIGVQNAGAFGDDDDSDRKVVECRTERLGQIGFYRPIGRRGLLRETVRFSPYPMRNDRHRPSPQTPFSSGSPQRSKFGRLAALRGSSIASRNPVVAFATRQTERRKPRRSGRASPWSDTGVASMLSRNVGDHGPRLGVMPSHLPPIGLPCGLFVMSLRWRLDYCDPA